MDTTQKFSIEEAKILDAPCTNFHWTPEDNTFGIVFGDFRLRDLESGITLVEISADERRIGEEAMTTEEDRIIRYDLGPDFLDLRTIGMQVQFTVGDKPVKDFRLIEKHFF